MDRKERRKRMIMKMNVVEYILRAGCAVIVPAFLISPMIICSGLTRHRRMIWTITECRDI